MNAYKEVKKTKENWDAFKKRWLKKPKELPPCPYGENVREWLIGGHPVLDSGEPTSRTPRGEVDTSYRNQLWCRQKKTFINPEGHSCTMSCMREREEKEKPVSMPRGVQRIVTREGVVIIRTGTGVKIENTKCGSCPEIKKCCGGKLTCKITGKNLLSDDAFCPIYVW